MDEFVNSRPNNIEPKHWHELVVDSAIHPLIVSANFKSLYYDSIEQCHESWEYLMYSDQIERKNAGRLTDKTLQASVCCYYQIHTNTTGIINPTNKGKNCAFSTN